MTEERRRKIWALTPEGQRELVPDMCYPGTRIIVFPKGGGWSFRLVNIRAEALTAEEAGRVFGSAETNEVWAKPSAAKSKALEITHDHDWLTAAGILFKDTSDLSPYIKTTIGELEMQVAVEGGKFRHGRTDIKA